MQNAIIVYNSGDFFRVWRKLPPETWLVWVDKGGEKPKEDDEK